MIRYFENVNETFRLVAVIFRAVIAMFSRKPRTDLLLCLCLEILLCSIEIKK